MFVSQQNIGETSDGAKWGAKIMRDTVAEVLQVAIAPFQAARVAKERSQIEVKANVSGIRRSANSRKEIGTGGSL